MTEADQWRQYIAELRLVAARAADIERQRKLLDLAERWTRFAEELSGSERDLHDAAADVVHAAEQSR